MGRPKPVVALTVAVGGVACVVVVVAIYVGIVGPERTPFVENFEGERLDSRISIGVKGDFESGPGIRDLSEDGGRGRAFGFGVSSCSGDCFDRYTSTLRVDFKSSRFVSKVSFKEQERGGNFGSDGSLWIDGEPLHAGELLYGHVYFAHFGRQPRNDHRGDTDWREREFTIDRDVRVIEWRVTDITSQGEIVIDDVTIR